MRQPPNPGRCCPVCFQSGPACRCGAEPDDLAELRARDPLTTELAQFTRMISPDDNDATLKLVHALRADPERERVLRVISALGDAARGTPQHYTWNKLWWLLYVPSAIKLPNPKPPRRRKR